MSAITLNSLMQMTDEEHEALSDRRLAIYEEKLKSILEPAYDKRFVAIHVDSEDYEVAGYSGEAMCTIRKRHLQGFLVIMKIGNEPEWGLAGRILAGELAAGRINLDLISTKSRSIQRDTEP